VNEQVVFILILIVWCVGIGFLDALDLEFFRGDNFPAIIFWPFFPIAGPLFLILATPFLIGNRLSCAFIRLKKARKT
jgi:hypothetical protein